MKQSHINAISKNPCYNVSGKLNVEENMPFSEKLSTLRTTRGFTQQQMAQMIGVGIAQMRRYEKGSSSPTLEIIKNIAKTLGVSSDELLFDEGESLASSRIPDKKLMTQFEMVSKLNPYDKSAIMTVIDSMIIKNRLEEVMPGHSDNLWKEQMHKVVSGFKKGAAAYSDDDIDNLVDEAVQAVRKEESKGD